MSKKFPDDMDYRQAMPCPHCKEPIEEFNISTKYIGCPNCEKPRKTSLAVMRLCNIVWCGDEKATVELRAGPELLMAGTLPMVLSQIQKEGWTVEGVNYDSYELARQKRGL